MMGVGSISASQLQNQSEGQQSGAVPRRPSHPAEDRPVSPPIGAPSDCALVSPVPHPTARLGETVSRIQSTLRWIDKAILCLQEVACAQKSEDTDGQPHDAAQFAEVIDPFTVALEHVLICLGSCQASMGPELRIGLIDGLPEKEGFVTLKRALSAWQNTPVPMDLDPRMVQDQATLDAYREHLETWLDQLADITIRGLEREEETLGIDLSFISKVNGHQLENELSAWLVAVGSTLAQAHLPLQPSRAAALLQSPLNT